MDASFLNEFQMFVEETNPYKDKNVMFPDIPVLLHSSDVYYMDCFLEAQMKKVFENIKTVPKTTFNDVEFAYNSKFNIFDMKQISSKFVEFNEYIKFMLQNNIIFDMKKYLVLKNIHCVSRQHQQWIFHNLTQIMRTHSVICTSLKLDNIIPHAHSHFCMIRLYPYVKDVMQQYAQYANITECKDIINDCATYDKDIFSSLLSMHTQSVGSIVEQELQKLINSIKKTKNINIYISKVRTIMYKLLVYNIPHTKIVRIIWNCIQMKYKKKQPIVFQSLSGLVRLDRDLLVASKSLYHYERFFLKLFRLVNSA